MTGGIMTDETSTGKTSTNTHDGGALESLLGPDSLNTDFAPIVDLLTREVIGYEAIVSGPAESAFANPAALSSAARAMDMTVDLDLVRWSGAVAGAARIESLQDLPLFIAIDPDIPPERQRVSLQLSGLADKDWQWRIDGLSLGSAAGEILCRGFIQGAMALVVGGGMEKPLGHDGKPEGEKGAESSPRPRRAVTCQGSLRLAERTGGGSCVRHRSARHGNGHYLCRNGTSSHCPPCCCNATFAC